MDRFAADLPPQHKLRYALGVFMLLVCVIMGYLIMMEKSVVILPDLYSVDVEKRTKNEKLPALQHTDLVSSSPQSTIPVEDERPEMSSTPDHSGIPKTDQSSIGEYKILPLVSQDVLSEYSNRLQHLRSKCGDPNIIGNASYSKPGQNVRPCSFSKEYNFCYCKVPKVGSTFFLQMLAILRKGPNASESAFSAPRKNVHISLSAPKRKKGDMESEPRSILVTRDPYSRLYSAFVDKAYLPNLWPLAKKVELFESNLKHKGARIGCGKDANFSNFVKMAVRDAQDGDTLNSHWRPISALCEPCKRNVFVIVRQEDFSSDVEFALRQLEVEDEKLIRILEGMRSRRVESTVPGIVETVLSKTKNGEASECLSHVEIAERIWISFQIQGFIQDNLPFPKSLVNTEDKAKNGKFFSNLILDTIHKHPMTSKESKDQRYKHLAMAYKTVAHDVISGIQAVYRQDFQLFNYSMEPPK